MDTAYVERANGQWECWTYSDQQRVYLMRGDSLGDIAEWCAGQRFRLVHV